MDYQYKLWKDFCQENKGYKRKDSMSMSKIDSYYYCDEMDAAVDCQELKESRADITWSDYVSFRINYFHKDLKNVLQRYSKNRKRDNEDIKLLYNGFNYYRNECGLLPVKYDIFSKFEKYKSILTQLMRINEKQDNEELSPVLMFFVLWNGLFLLFRKFEMFKLAFSHAKDGFGFDAYVHASYVNEPDGALNSLTLVNDCTNFLSDRISSTGNL